MAANKLHYYMDNCVGVKWRSTVWRSRKLRVS